jgi:hypothetical protein
MNLSRAAPAARALYQEILQRKLTLTGWQPTAARPARDLGIRRRFDSDHLVGSTAILAELTGRVLFGHVGRHAISPSFRLVATVPIFCVVGPSSIAGAVVTKREPRSWIGRTDDIGITGDCAVNGTGTN